MYVHNIIIYNIHFSLVRLLFLGGDVVDSGDVMSKEKGVNTKKEC